jgi:hypothetical protein
MPNYFYDAVNARVTGISVKEGTRVWIKHDSLFFKWCRH